MKKILATTAVLFSLFIFATSVSADCGGQYDSPCQSYSISVNKMVQKPGTLDYFNNLSINDPRYKPSNYVYFMITIKNTSTTNLDGITAKDFVPDYLTPVEGPGTFDSTARTISWNAGAFALNEQKNYYFKMQINSQANLPANQGLFCLVNRVHAWSTTATDDASSQFCIEKQVTGTVKVPSAGPELGTLLLTGELALLGAGIYLKKKA